MAQSPDQLRKRPAAPPVPSVSIDAWTLKCLYNTSDYPRRVLAEEFVPLWTESSKPRGPDGERTVQVYYGLPADKLVLVKLQWFENSAGEITRSGWKEPKWMHFEGANFPLHSGGRWWQVVRRDVTELRPQTRSGALIWLKKRY